MLPHLSGYARSRASQISLPLSTYFGVLLWNFVQAPRKMKPEPAAAAFARVHVPCSLRPSVWSSSAEAIKKSGLNPNSLLEALVAEDKRGSQAGLWIKAKT